MPATDATRRRPDPRGAPGGRPAASSAVLVLLVAAAVLAGCLGPEPAPEEGPSWGFEPVGPGSGLDHVVGHELPEGVSSFHKVGGAVTTADVDGDGRTDVFVGDFGENHLYRNLGNGTFRDVTGEAGLAGSSNFTTAAVPFDYQGDGDLDLFLVNYEGPSRLYRNDGDGTFTEVTGEAGLGNATPAYGAAAADVDGDGDLDLTVVNYGSFRGGRDASPYSNATNGERDLLYVNQGDGTFEEEGLERGLTATRWSFSHAFADVDGDGDRDLHMNVDFGYDVYYENDGTGNFTPATRERGLVTNRNGMGAVWTDVDGDLDRDLFITNVYVPGNHSVDVLKGNNLFVQGEDGTFRDEAAARGVADGGWGWDSQWFDVDHDGDVDGLQANGEDSAGSPDLFYNSTAYLLPHQPQPRPGVEYATIPKYNATHWLVLELKDGFEMSEDYSVAGYQRDRVFVNDGAGRFTDQAARRGLGGWADSRAYGVLDVGRDGDLDVVRTVADRPVELLRNTAVDEADGEEPRHWIQVQLRAPPPNTRAAGAHVTVEAGDVAALRDATTSGGFMSHDPPGLVHVGLGGQEVVDELAVTWPDGERVVHEDVEADQRVQVTRGEGLETLWSG